MQTGESSFLNVTSDTGFDVDVSEAVQLLGVSRTRLSQLVSKGVLGYERRRVDTRMRMYFSRIELLSYLRRQMAGASARASQEWMFETPESEVRHDRPLPPRSSEGEHATPTPSANAPRSIMRHGLSPALARSVRHPRVLASALRAEQRLQQDAHKQIVSRQEETRQHVRSFEKKLHQLEQHQKSLVRHSPMSALTKQPLHSEPSVPKSEKRKMKTLSKRGSQSKALIS